MKKNKKIIVTGGAGFIGSHMSDFLIKKKYDVTIIDNLSYGKKQFLNKKAKFLKGDIRNLNFLKKSFKNVDAVFHFAAMSRSGPSDKEIDLCLIQNTIGTKNVLEACRINKVKKLIYAGSSTYYGNTMGKQSENDKSDFINPYSISKYFGEQLCIFYNKKKFVNCSIVRYFNVYGTRQPLTGQYALVIGIFLNKRKKNQKLKIYGDGYQKRDFIHIDDVIKANYKVLKSGKNGEVYNVGFGKNITINYLAQLISKKIIHTKKRIGEARETLANIKKLKKLNWSPKIQIEKGIKLLLNEKDYV